MKDLISFAEDGANDEYLNELFLEEIDRMEREKIPEYW